MTGDWPTSEVDHRDVDKSKDNWANLRPATKPQNEANRGKNRNNTSGFKGVSFNRDRSKWSAKIGINGKLKHLGYFASAESAYTAYCEAAAVLHGEFFRGE